MNEAAVEKVIFLTSRPAKPRTAILVAGGSQGWIRFWSLLHSTGLMGQFNACSVKNESVVTMTTDPTNRYLITGDSVGYIKVWDIWNYCIQRDNPQTEEDDKLRMNDLRKEFPLLTNNNEMSNSKCYQDIHRAPPLVSRPEVTHKVPLLLTSIKGHSQGISDLSYIPTENVIISASMDQSIRLWTVSGEYKGVLGNDTPWPYDQMAPKGTRFSENFPPDTVPTDLKRSASAVTLKVMNKGRTPHWFLVKKIVGTFIPMLKSFKPKVPKEESYRDTLEEKSFHKVEDDGTTPKSSRRDSKSPKQCILGKSVSIHRKHQRLPKLDNVREFNTQVAVYSTLKCHELEDLDLSKRPEYTARNFDKFKNKKNNQKAVNIAGDTLMEKMRNKKRRQTKASILG